MPKLSASISSTDRVIITVSEEILVPIGFFERRGQHCNIVSTNKPAPPRVIVPALQIVQPRFRVVDVSAVAQGVLFAEGGGQRAGGAQRIAPCVVGVGHDAGAAGADKAGHVALRVLDVEILRAVAVHGQRAGRVVGEVQLVATPRQLHQLVTQIMVIVRHTVDALRDALAVGIVAVSDIRPGLAHPRELAAVLPCVGPRPHLLAFYGYLFR